MAHRRDPDHHGSPVPGLGRLGLGLLGLVTLLVPAALPHQAARAQPATEALVESGGNNAEPELSDKEKELLERIRKMKAPRWRTFGNCRYDWSSWRLSEGGVRTTGTECGQPPVAGSVAVHCGTLKVALRAADGSWQPWRLPVTQEESPEGGGEDRMVASLCANIQPPPAAATPASGKPASSAKPASPAKPAAPGKPGAPPQPAGTQPASPAPAQPKAP